LRTANKKKREKEKIEEKQKGIIGEKTEKKKQEALEKKNLTGKKRNVT